MASLILFNLMRRGAQKSTNYDTVLPVNQRSLQPIITAVIIVYLRRKTSAVVNDNRGEQSSHVASYSAHRSDCGGESNVRDNVDFLRFKKYVLF